MENIINIQGLRQSKNIQEFGHKWLNQRQIGLRELDGLERILESFSSCPVPFHH